MSAVSRLVFRLACGVLLALSPVQAQSPTWERIPWLGTEGLPALWRDAANWDPDSTGATTLWERSVVTIKQAGNRKAVMSRTTTSGTTIEKTDPRMATG